MNADEFDDIDHSHDPFVSSCKARAEMTRLATLHHLTFWHNPGGGEFEKPGFRCQIGCCDDIADLATLRAALEAKP